MNNVTLLHYIDILNYFASLIFVVQFEGEGNAKAMSSLQSDDVYEDSNVIDDDGINDDDDGDVDDDGDDDD